MNITFECSHVQPYDNENFLQYYTGKVDAFCIHRIKKGHHNPFLILCHSPGNQIVYNSNKDSDDRDHDSLHLNLRVHNYNSSLQNY